MVKSFLGPKVIPPKAEPVSCLASPVLLPSYKDVPWDSKRWPNFKPIEFACRCGEFYFDSYAFDCLQTARTNVGQPLRINSGHRCSIHNAKVGGAPDSQHLNIAFDISILTIDDPPDLYGACLGAGLRGFGFYSTFLHADTGPEREWNLEYKHIFTGANHE